MIDTKKVQAEYQRGKQYKESLGLYDTCKQNENFYAGKHWEGLKTSAVKPLTFNVVRRIISTAQALVVSDDIGFEVRPYLSTAETDNEGRIIEESLRAVIERQKIKTLNRTSLHDCAVFGDSCLYFWFDPDLETGQHMTGDIRAEVLMNTNVIFGNSYSADVQGQPYILIAQRLPVEVVRQAAKADGVLEWENIRPDYESRYIGEDEQTESKLATVLTRFWKVRAEDGERVHFARICGEIVLKDDTETKMQLYPLAWWSWIDRKNSMHGISPVTEAIPTQIAINQMMTYIYTFNRNLAFPKFIYDVRKFPNGWDPSPGKAIAVSGEVNQAMMNVFQGIQLPSGIQGIVEMMRNMLQDSMGASDAQLGNVRPDNTSAIIAAQKASSAPLELQKRKFEQFNEDCIRVMIDMMCAYYGDRIIVLDETVRDPVTGEESRVKRLAELDFDQLRIGQLDINVEVGAASYWSELVQQTTMDNLYERQIITDPELYLESIPGAQIPNKQGLLRWIAEQKRKMQGAQPAAGGSAPRLPGMG
ncbi:MAG: hypothetical protein Q3Y08_06240 [Butyricicoccus sp.]|nr:hypothetical protein [Butyricicoccus sp.]